MKDIRLGPKDFDLLGFNFKMALSNFRLGGQDQLPWLMEAGEKLDPLYNTICVHPRVAAARGLKEGQAVWVESKYGKTRGQLHVSELFHPDSVGIGGALGRMVNTLGKAPAQRTHFNQLLGAPLNTIDPIAGGVENTVRVKVYAA
jgi:anaerobic selenocysteine-containing dehydrogenase